LDILLPRTAPPTSPAAPVTSPTTIEVFDEELELELDLARVALLPLRDAELPLRDDDDGDLRLEALVFARVLFPVLLDREELLADLPFEELLGRLLRVLPAFEPLELRDVCLDLLDELLLAWAIRTPPGSFAPASKNAYPQKDVQNVLGQVCRVYAVRSRPCLARRFTGTLT
jgi:hypothetical protein